MIKSSLLPGASSGLEIRLLGPLEVRVAGTPLVVDTRKALAILALLATERRPFARDELAAMLWPEADDESARGALRRTLSVLRTALGDRWLSVDRSTVDLDGAWVDLTALEGAASGSDVEALRGAADLARGPFLAGFSLRDSAEFDDWRATHAVAVERTITGALDRLVTASQATGDLAGAVSAAHRLVDLDPLDEPAHRRLIELLGRSGDRAGAIRQYRACVAVLERELGVAPLAETTDLYEAIRDGRLAGPPGRPLGAAATQAPAAPAGRLPLIARDTELATLLAAHREAVVDGRIVLLVGEAGIGKTRLAEAAADAVAAVGGTALVARSFAAETGVAYGPVVELLRAGIARPGAADRLGTLSPVMLATLARLIPLSTDARREQGTGSSGSSTAPKAPPAEPPADEPGARARLLDAIATALTALVAGPVPGCVILEDAQWTDDASREAIAWLARRLEGRSLVLVLTWRPEDLDDLGAGFATALEALPRTTGITLRRLDRAAIGQLVAAVGATGHAAPTADELYEESEGLPLYAVEALAALSAGGDGAARSVRALLRERLATVGETAGQVLSAAAVIGRTFDLPLVRDASGRTEEETITALEELVRRGLVREREAGSEVRYDFAHAKLREAAYDATSLSRRRLLHRRVAEHLRAAASGRSESSRLALVAIHERAAGRDAAASEAFRQAGLIARTLFAHREAAAHLETALALGHPDVAGIQLVLGEERTALGDYAGAIAALEGAAALADEASLPLVELRLGRVHARRGDLETAASHLEAAIEALAPPADVAGASSLVRALVERAVVALRGRDLDRARASASRALELAETAADGSGAGAATRLLGLVARDRGDLATAEAALRRSLALAEADPDPSQAIAARNALALTVAASGDRPAAIALLEAALDASRRTGERHLEAAIENNLADQLHADGRKDEAMAHLKQAVAIFAEVGGTPDELEPEIWKLVAW